MSHQPLSHQLQSHTSIVAEPTADAALLTYWPVTGAIWATIGATCQAAGGSITYRVIFTDYRGVLTGCSPSVTLTASNQAADFGGQWIGTPSSDPSFTVTADRMAVMVDAISGVWTINAHAFLPGAYP